MKRRDFLKYLGVGGAGAGLGFLLGKVSKPPGAKLIPYLIPPEDIVPGVANWYASLCTGCAAGCGVIVKVMEGRAKKIEGNPLHPVSKGRLCARGQALPQSLYNPDRIKGPLKLRGERGKGEYDEISWEEAVSILAKNLSELGKSNNADKLYMVSAPLRGHLSSLVSNFLSSYGSWNYFEHELFDRRNLLYANQVSMGIGSVPHYDIENTKYLLSFGADLSSAGLSPVSYSHAYGRMRQGGAERGKLVQVEPRLSLTGANADEWVPAKPGTEGILALSIACAMVEKGLYRGGDSGTWRSVLGKYRPQDAAKITDISEDRIYRIAKEFAENRPSLAIAGDNAASYENGASVVVAANILNHLAGSIGAKGGVLPNPEGVRRAEPGNNIAKLVAGAEASRVKALIVNNTNPVFTTPKALKTAEAFAKIPFIASFSSFMDETTAMADLILPSHTSLEDWGDDYAEPAPGYAVATIMQPAVSPVFNTKGVGDIILETSKALGSRVRDRAPWNTFNDYLKESWREVYNRSGASSKARNFDEFWEQALANGGWWPASDQRRGIGSVSAYAVASHIPSAPSSFDGDGRDYPFYLTVYPNAGHSDGRGANLPWLQELPDPMTSVVWGSWIEINPKTAESLGVKEGDLVAVESPYGRIEAPVYIFPGIRPDTVSMPVGQGHSQYGRYAKDRGANPIEVLPFKQDPSTGALALNSTRVRVTRISGPGGLVKAEGSTKELNRGIVQTVSPEAFRKMKKEVV